MLLITGGSQGSKALNDAVSAGLDALLDIPDLSILWQTGGTHAEACRASAEEVLIHRPAYDRPRLRVEGFLHDMNVAWSATDLALCRSGASTIAELGRVGVPSLLVPLATSAGGHQEANARAMERAGAAYLLLEEELDGSRVAEEVRGLLEGDGLITMATAAARLVHAGAAHRIAAGLVEHAVDLTTREREAVIARLGRVTS